MAAVAAVQTVNDDNLTRLYRYQLDKLSPELKAKYASAYLHDNVTWAAGLIRELQAGKDANLGIEKLDAASLRQAQGLAFINATKVGLGVGVARGYGFVVQRVGDRWSQPVFFTVGQAGVGLVAGYQHNQSVIVLRAHEPISIFAKQGSKGLGGDLFLWCTDEKAQLAGMPVRPNVGTNQMAEGNVRALTFTKADGVYVEAALHALTITPDKESNEFLYGADYDAEKLLNDADGRYAVEMAPLAATITNLSVGQP